MIKYKTAITVLILGLLLIPTVWLMGHRANNSLLFVFVLFAFFMKFSNEFAARVSEGFTRLAIDVKKRKRLIIGMLAFALLLAILSFFNNHRCSFLHLDSEKSLGTLYSGFLLAASVPIIYLCMKEYERKKDRWKWIPVGSLFALMALDELSEFHHWLVYDIWHFISGKGQEVLIDGIVLWLTLLSPFIFAIIIGLLLFIFRVLSKDAGILALAGLSFWIVSQLLEATIEGHLISLHILEISMEEFCEMAGSILFIGSFLAELDCLKKRKEVNTSDNMVSDRSDVFI